MSPYHEEGPRLRLQHDRERGHARLTRTLRPFRAWAAPPIARFRCTGGRHGTSSSATDWPRCWSVGVADRHGQRSAELPHSAIGS